MPCPRVSETSPKLDRLNEALEQFYSKLDAEPAAPVTVLVASTTTLGGVDPCGVAGRVFSAARLMLDGGFGDPNPQLNELMNIATPPKK